MPKFGALADLLPWSVFMLVPIVLFLIWLVICCLCTRHLIFKFGNITWVPVIFLCGRFYISFCEAFTNLGSLSKFRVWDGMKLSEILQGPSHFCFTLILRCNLKWEQYLPQLPWQVPDYSTYFSTLRGCQNPQSASQLPHEGRGYTIRKKSNFQPNWPSWVPRFSKNNSIPKL